MKYSIDQLRQVKGIGEKTIQRIIEQFDESEYISKYNQEIHIEPNSLINGDMLEVMNGIPDKSVDMILCDPPYMIDYQSGWRKDRFSKLHNDINSYDMIEKFISQSHRVLKKDGTIYIYCSWKTYPEFKKIVETKFNIKNVIVWNKNNHGSGDLKSGYAPKHEFVIYAQKGRKLYNGGRQSDVQSFSKVPSTKMLHPTEKPVEMLENFIKYDTKEQDVVLDPFMGAGSTCLAAKNTGRKYIGIELEKEYFEIAKKRLEEL